MDGDQTVGVLWGLGAVVLVGSALLARRLPAGTVLRMAAAWAAIFAGVILVALAVR
jgi:aspartyl protease family protein